MTAMTERIFRLFLGISLLAFLYFDLDGWIYAYIALLVFEGVTNLRIPIIVSRLRFGPDYRQYVAVSHCDASIPFDAERALRIIVFLLLLATFVMFPQQTWFFPWFIGTMLLMAGITNICPMVMGLRWLGFR